MNILHQKSTKKINFTDGLSSSKKYKTTNITSCEMRKKNVRNTEQTHKRETKAICSLTYNF